MSQYSIKDIEELSGIKAHTLRIWEKRYDLIDTKRTDTNIRYYDDEDLKYLLNVAFLVQNGFKISKVAKLNKDDVVRQVRELSEKESSFDVYVNDFISAMVDLDELKFEKTMSSCIIKFGMEATFTDIIYPLLQKVGVLWLTGSINPAQEHFISNLIRQKLILAIDGLIVKDPELTRKYLLFLPDGEFHELGLLFANYVVRSRANHSLYLGQSVPHNDLKEVYKYYQPDFIFMTATVQPAVDTLEAYIKQLSVDFPESKILVAGVRVGEADLEGLSNVVFIRDLKDSIEFVEQHTPSRKERISRSA